MPAEIPAHAAIRLRLKEAANHAGNLQARLEPLIAIKSRQPSGGFHGKIDHSQPPWNAPVAHAITDLHSLARKMERELQGELGLPQRERGGSDVNTGKALDAVVRLAEGADDVMVRLCTRELEKWSRRASVALDELEIPRRLPRVKGKPEPQCPFCKNHTLRSKAGQGQIFCINPSCKDEKGRKPEAHMEYSRYADDMVLVWQDDVVGLP